MRDKFRDKYRISSARLINWDYSSNGFYFLTICTKNRENLFGEIINNKMRLSEVGLIVRKYWLEIPRHFPFVKLDEFMVMPNHVHGIIIIMNVETPKSKLVETPKSKLVETPKSKLVETPKLGVSTIINQFKRICTIEIRKRYNRFAWQSRFYDHIIRDEKSLNNIREYIRNNPKNWHKDRNNLEDLYM